MYVRPFSYMYARMYVFPRQLCLYITIGGGAGAFVIKRKRVGRLFLGGG